MLTISLNSLQHEDFNMPLYIPQLAFTKFTAHQFSVHTSNKVSNMTPYRSGFPIDSIPPIDSLYPVLPRCKKVYQTIFSCINWLATCNRTGIDTVLKFIASYRNVLHKH